MLQLQITTDKSTEVELIKSAIVSEIRKLELSIKKTDMVISKFESKYKISSISFINDWTAENLEGGDNEYVEWSGEFKLRRRLFDKLNSLKGIKYVVH